MADQKTDPKVYRLALTGGPCGGKSSSLEHLTKTFTAKGYDVFCVPEVPTILMSGGCKYPGVNGGQKLVEFETALIQLQMQIEDSFTKVAKSTGKPALVVMDRGLMDIKAYLPEDKWNEILKVNGMTEDGFLQRYDMVLHLVTAADGAEKFYTLGNNATRTETPEQARELDKKMVDCWKQHKAHIVIGNHGDFKGKLEDATNAVLKTAGL